MVWAIESLKLKIEEYCVSLREASNLYKKADAGILQITEWEHFLRSVHFLVLQTPVHLKLAEKSAQAKGEDDLAQFFKDKFLEEQGHDEWASDDLSNAQRLTDHQQKSATHPDEPPVQAAFELSKFLERVIETDPRLYLSYICFAEYATVVNGDTLIRAVRKSLGNDFGGFTVISKHADLDKEHIIDDFEAIKLFWPKDIEPQVFETLSTVMQLHKRLCDDVCTPN